MSRIPDFARLAMGAALAVALAACGGGSDEGPATTGQSAPGHASSSSGEQASGGLPSALQDMQVNDHGSKTVVGMDEVSVEMDDFYFEPTVLVGSPGQTITLELENEGSEAHTFTIGDQDVDQVLQPGDTMNVEVTFPDDGSTAFECRFHEDQGMRGALAVQSS